MVILYMYFGDGAVGEVVNTLVCGTSMREFDSHTTPHLEYERTFNKSFFMFLHEMKILVHNNKKEIF